MTMTCDIIVPAYNSARTLPLTLPALFAQAVPPGWTVRVLLSDDGSSDETVDLARRHAGSSSWVCDVFTGRHAGAAAARNRALDRSTAEVVLFTQADIVLRPGALAAHLSFHRTHPAVTAGALGWVGWDQRIQPTALMEWMTHSGPQNAYDALLGARSADPRHFFYGAHVSVKRAMINTTRFSKAFTGYGWEDLDFGRRLAERGLTLRVLLAAQGLHHHHYAVADVVRRQVAAGRGLSTYQQQHPNDDLVPKERRSRWYRWQLYRLSGAAMAVRWLVSSFPGRTWPRLFSLLSREAFWSGIYGSNK